MIYTSVNNVKIKGLKKLSQKKYRDETNTFLVETWHLVNEAYSAGILDEILVLEGVETEINVKVNYISKNVLKYLSNMPSPSEVIGICHKNISTQIGNKVLILDDVQDPGNIGTIIRSAVAFNIDTIILSQGCADVYSDKVIRSSQGMIFKMNLLYGSLSESINKLKKANYKVYGTKVDGGKTLKNIEKVSKFAIIMGNEGNGVSKDILDLCDEYIYIPINKKCESLNVGVATSIILYELGG